MRVRRGREARRWLVAALVAVVSVVGVPAVAAADDVAEDGSYVFAVSFGDVHPYALIDVEVTGPTGTTTSTLGPMGSGAVLRDPPVVAAAHGDYLARVTGRGGVYAEVDVAFTVSAGAPTTVPVRLVANRGDVTGRVVQPSGRAAGRVVVTVRSSAGDVVSQWPSALDGSYRFESLTPGRYGVSAGDDRTEVEVVADTVTSARDLVAPAPVDVSGRVTFPAGVDESDLLVTLTSATGSGATPAGWSRVDGGAFHVARVPQGSYLLEVTDQEDVGLVAPLRRVVTFGEDDPVDLGTLVLSAGAPIMGVVRDAAGRPSRDRVQSVEVSCSTGEASPVLMHQAWSDPGPDGRFRLPAVPGSCYRLEQMSTFWMPGMIAPSRVAAGTGGVVLHPRYELELTASDTVGRYGSATFRVKVSTPVPASVAVPSGTLQLALDGKEDGPVATARIVGGYATFALGTKIRPGLHIVTAFARPGEFADAGAGAALVVEKASSSVSVKATHVRYGQRAKVTVTVHAKVPVSGKVTVELGGRRVGVGTVHKKGSTYVAVVTTSRLAAHHHALVVRYHGSSTVSARTVTSTYRT